MRPRTGKAAAHTRVGDRWQAIVPLWDSGPVESAECGDYALFAPEEADRWQRAGETWTRRGTNPIRLQVALSRIGGAGHGLFATVDMEDGTRLGRMHGVILASGTLDEVENVGILRAETRSIALRVGGRSEDAWALVQVEGAFAFMNHEREHPNVHVSETGWVETCADVRAGDELVWPYGELFAV